MDNKYPVASIHALEHVKDPDDLKATIEHWTSKLEQDKWIRAVNWFSNASFLAGSHYDNWSYNGNGLDKDNPVVPFNSMDQYVPKTADNKLLRPFEINVSLLTEMDPRPSVAPNSAAPEDEDAADLAEIFFKLVWEKPLRLPEKLRQIASYLVLTGTAAMEVEYTNTQVPQRVPALAEVEIADPITGEPVIELQPTGEEAVEFKKDLVARAWSGFHLNVNPDATDDLDSITWIMRTTFEDVTEITNLFDKNEEGYFPENLERVQAYTHSQSSKSSSLWYWERLKDVLDSPEHSYNRLGTQSSDSTSNQTIVQVIDARPNADFPEGRTIVLAGGQLIYEGPARAWSEEYPERWNPYTLFRFYRQPGRWWGSALFSHLVPLQKRVNALDAIIQINREYLNLGQWLIPERSMVAEGELSGLPGAHITYRGPNPPQKVPHQPLSGDIYNERGQLIQSINEIASIDVLPQMEAARSNVRAGSMIDKFRANAMSSKRAMLLDFADAIQNMAQNILIETSLRMNEDDSELTKRLQVAARDHSSLAIESFTGQSLRDNVHIQLDIMEQVMTTAEALAEKAMTWFQFAGQNASPGERAKAAKMMGMDFDEAITPHRERARRMVAKVLAGKAELVTPYEDIDDPAIFTEVFKTEILKDRTEDLEEEIKNELFGLYFFYKDLADKAMQAQMQQMMAAQGGKAPPEASEPEPNPED